MQLSAKALLRPFTSTADIDTADIVDNTTADNMEDEPARLEEIEEDVEEDSHDEEEDVDNGGDEPGVDDDNDALDDLTEEERVALVANTASVRTTLDKVFLKLYSFRHED